MWLVTLALVAPRAAPRFDDRSPDLGEPAIGWVSDGLHGVAWLDSEGDGDLDLVHTNAVGAGPVLWLNDGAGGFEVHPTFGQGLRSGTSGVLAADLDGDERTDLLFLGQGQLRLPASRAILLRNTGGNTFVDVSAPSGLGAATPPVQLAATAGDVDGDGDLEVLVASTGRFAQAVYPDALLFEQNGRWVDRAAAYGVDEANGNCVASFVHLDDDAWIDLLVASCARLESYAPRMYRNDGGTRFVRVDVERRVWSPGWYMGFAVGDLDENGFVDFFATNNGDANPAILAPPVLWLQGDDGAFHEVPSPPGIGQRFGWGTTTQDFDLDGHLDLVQVGSPQTYKPDLEAVGSAGDLGIGRGDGTFDRGDLGADLTDRLLSGLAAADYDGDGWVDLAGGVVGDAIARTPNGPVLLRNRGGEGTWLTVRLRDPDRPNTAGIGSRITATLPDGRTLERQVLAGTSFASTESPWPTFGLAGAEEAALCVRWPDGATEDFGMVSAGARFDAVRGAGAGPCGGASGPPGPFPERVPPRGCGCGGGRPPGAAAIPGALLALVVAANRRRIRARRP